MPIQITTTLPDEDQPVLGNGVEDEVAVDRESAPTNYGDVRIQIRETGQSAWDASAEGFGEFVGAYDTLSMEFVGRLDGEEYEVRARTETEHVTGAWTEPVAITTKFPGVTELTATAISETEVELEWIDNADNESGQEVIRERRVNDGWWPERIVEDVGPNTESFVDDTAPSDTELRYRIRAYTPYAEGVSNTDTATTDDLGIPRRRIPASGWRVEIEHPDQDAPLTPTVLEGATPKAILNDFPRVEIPVPESGRWDDDTLERAEMRVWKDGERLPIERFERPVREPGRVVLHGRGGIELDKDVEFDVGQIEDVDDVVRELLDTETPYAKTVDDPAADVRGDVSVLTADTTTTYQSAFAEIDAITGNDVPVELLLNPSRIATAPIAWLQSSDEAVETPQLARIDEPDTYWRGRAHRLEQSGDALEWDFDVRHAVDAGNVALRIRKEQPVADENPGVRFYLDGTEIGTYPVDLEGSTSEGAPEWFDLEITSTVTDDLDAGTHTLRVEVIDESASSDGEWIVDGFGAGDDAYPVDWSLGSGASAIVDGVIQGPPIYPDSVQITTEIQSTIEQVIGGRFTVDANNTAGQFAVEISNDGGETWVSASNTEEVEGAFASGTTQLQGRVTLSRFDEDATTSPAVGDGRQEISGVDLFADLDTTPFAQGSAYDGTVMEVLQQLADTHGFIFELAWDDTAETISVEWTQPGQRQATTSAPVLDYQTETDSETVVEKTIVYGRSRRVRDQEVELPPDGLADIGDDYIQPGTERVADPDTGEVYTIGDDYEILFNEGVIGVVDGGALDGGATVIMDFETRIAAEYELPSADGSGDTIRETVESASTRQLASQAAIAITTRLSEPQRGARVTLDRERGFGLVGALDIEDVPAGPQVVREIEGAEREVDVRLGDRLSAREVIDDVRQRVESVARRL
ncbi:hypothetical protein C461_03168 [Halorubrum aidingense JCM 13560]|uniref:Fibronectin type-III domain-containing protein n=1 Tax=Halorubrum aidingense JCM 13560 TaxID=1230454 RepID=M0PHD2_9EURY|nr:hypothetical protein [Halorubrum aidingense]EMA69328.1 hypothetical protein C461_03168 [Halorubrum aidingense JCM 13560]